MELVFLGTSAAVPTRQRNLSSVMLVYNGEQILFDAGEDVQRRFEDVGLKFNAPLSIFISHMHGDHVIGLPGLLFHFTLISRTQEVKIWGPPGIFPYLYLHRMVIGMRAPFLHDVFEIYSDKKIICRYDFHSNPDQIPEEIPITDGIIYDNPRYTIQAIPMDHSVATNGFRFHEKPLPGRFHPEIAQKLKIPQGHLWKKMQMGDTVEYKGKIYDPESLGIVGPKRSGCILSYSADTKICENVYTIAKNADVFICEATFADDLKDLAEEKKHMTAFQCAEVAKKSNVSYLILTHISSRYTDGQKLLDEAQTIFPNSTIAHDLMRFVPTKENPLD